MKRIFFLVVLIITAAATFSQNVGIGITNPQARLHVADSSVLFTGPASLPVTPGLPPVSGIGTRFMWYPNKAAFRVGQVLNSTYWNEASVGKHSIAAGLNTRASGQYSIAFGTATYASGEAAFAWGNSTFANGTFATASGINTTASAYASAVMGRYNVIAGNSSQWVETDPLFVIGNGSVQEVSPGIGEIVRSNAFQVNKNGNTTVSGVLEVKGTGTSYLRQSTVVEGVLDIKGNTVLRANASVSGQLNVDTINTIKRINANYSIGTTPAFNMVPIGVAKVKILFDRGVISDDCIASYTNLAGDLITVGIATCGDPTGGESHVGAGFSLRQSITNQYTEIISVSSLSFYNGSAVSTATEGLNVITNEVENKNSIWKYLIGFGSSNIPTTGDYYVAGTVIFYGLN